MSSLSRFFLARTPKAAVADEPSTFFDARGITDVEVESLDEIVTGANRFPDDVETDDDDVLIFQLDPELVKALAAVLPAQVRSHAERWAETEELEGSTVEALSSLIEQLVGLAKQSLSEKQGIYLRVTG